MADFFELSASHSSGQMRVYHIEELVVASLLLCWFPIRKFKNVKAEVNHAANSRNLNNEDVSFVRKVNILIYLWLVNQNIYTKRMVSPVFQVIIQDGPPPHQKKKLKRSRLIQVR